MRWFRRRGAVAAAGAAAAAASGCSGERGTTCRASSASTSARKASSGSSSSRLIARLWYLSALRRLQLAAFAPANMASALLGVAAMGGTGTSSSSPSTTSARISPPTAPASWSRHLDSLAAGDALPARTCSTVLRPRTSLTAPFRSGAVGRYEVQPHRHRRDGTRRPRRTLAVVEWHAGTRRRCGRSGRAAPRDRAVRPRRRPGRGSGRRRRRRQLGGGRRAAARRRCAR